MDVIEELDDPHVPIAQACATLGVSRATLYRQTQPARPPALRGPVPSPRRLSDPERQTVLDVLHSDEFVDQPPPEVYATLLSRGVYHASIRTMYRLLAASGESGERRAQRGPTKHAKPTLTATAPNQIWTWDITKLRGPLPGVFYCLYVVLDLFSRMTVGWLLAERESAELAEHLFAETVARHGVEPGSLTVHADRGSAMRSEGLAQLLGSLGVVRSFSRPHVSDDNAFSESQFKTLKYQPDYPDRFASLAHARFEAKRRRPLTVELDGFNVEAAVRIEGYDDEGRERLVRYCARPCFALERLSILRDGRVAYQVKYPRRKGTHRVMTPIVFFARLAALVPPPRHPLVRYHGVLAPHAKQRSLVVPKATGKARKGEQRAGADSAGSDDKKKTTTITPLPARQAPKGPARGMETP
ncbi:DDE-type integrase/transposase/recombinase [Sorangium atrum]|uniref:Transposase n=1 Tax=Sorangium atrum TaxID=2995308 RepID=A0ABT5CAI7_9BACT|nr:DDE-type integrase/transposase/recombinase [Sorangium aterium]MDC0683446.1 transposase [Sorangium aterium]